MSDTNKTNRIAIADIEVPVKELTDTEASAVNGGLVGLLFTAWALLGQNYASDNQGWLTMLGNKIGNSWAREFPKK